MKYCKSRQTAFTLIEILIALAIVGVLSALLFPVFSNVRENARRTACASNLKQIGAASLMYVQDHDGRFMPVLGQGKSIDGKVAFWFRLLQPYVKDQQIFQCPSDDTDTFDKYEGHASYGYNAHIGGAALPQFLPPGVEASSKVQSQIMRPSATVMMTDSGSIAMTMSPGFTATSAKDWPGMVPCPAEIGDAAVLNSTPPPKPGTGNVPVGALPAPRARHQGKTNVLWADGHVTSASIESFYMAPGVTAPGETIPGYSPCLRPEKGCF